MYERWLILVQRYALLLFARGFTDLEARTLATLAASYTLDPGFFAGREEQAHKEVS